MIRHHHVNNRTGFTLVELLVVIGIIVTLVALSAAGTFRWIENTRINNTIATLQTLDDLLQKHWAKVVADARKEEPSPAVYQLGGGDPPRAQVLWIKVRLLEAFPLSYAEISPPPIAGVPQPPPVYAPIAALGGQSLIPQNKRRYIASYQRMLGSLAGTNPPTQAETAACLRLALSVDRGVGKVDLDPYSADTNGDGLKELVDNWNVPLGFYRFPWANLDMDASNPATPGSKASKCRDPLDPAGVLLNPNWNNYLNFNSPPLPLMSAIRIIEKYCHPIHEPQGGETAVNYQPVSYYMVPTLVSGGSNGRLGHEPGTMRIINSADANDNLYSYKLRIGSGEK